MTCYKYWGKILEIADTIKKYNGNVPKDVRFSILKSLEKIAHDNTISFDEAQHIFKNKFMSKALNVIYNFYNKMSVQMEIEHAEKVINSDDPWKTLKSFYFYDRYVKLVQNEAMLAKYNSDDRIVFIGGGPLPLTLILTNKLFSMKGVSIEIVPKLAEKSKKVLEKLGLSNEIKVVCGDETALKNLNFDIVIIAALAEPKKRVFKNKKICKSENKDNL